jgi:preprotein translocase subunit SecF
MSPDQAKAATVAEHLTRTRRGGFGAYRRLYRGETSFDFVGRRRLWFTISAVIIGLGLISLGVRGLNLGIDFKGGTAWTVKAPGVTQSQATAAMQAAGLPQPVVELLGRGPHQQLEVQADLNALPQSQQARITQNVVNELARLGHTNPESVSVEIVGPTWGGEVTTRALVALIVFFIAVGIYISFRFEPKMALAAFLAMVHDLLVTMGVYSLAGFQVTPDTVIAILTILGYSLYDTVVVFDRVRENTKGVGSTGRMTYSDMINLSMNQTLARSINTSLVAILPVLAVLVVGAEILGATTLQDYGLALVVGLLSGAYSSIFIASPVLAVLREREPRYAAIRQRLGQRADRAAVMTPAAASLALSGSNGVEEELPRPVPSNGRRNGQRDDRTKRATPRRGAARGPAPKTGDAVLRPGAASRAREPAGDDSTGTKPGDLDLADETEGGLEGLDGVDDMEAVDPEGPVGGDGGTGSTDQQDAVVGTRPPSTGVTSGPGTAGRPAGAPKGPATGARKAAGSQRPPARPRKGSKPKRRR